MPVYNYTTLDDPAANNLTQAFGINTAGQIVGTYFSNSFYHGFLYTGGTYSNFDEPSAANGITNAFGVNDAGQIVGYYNDGSGNHGFLLSGVGGAYTTLNDPLGTHGTVAPGINDSGQIVGYYTDGGSHIHGFLYSAGTYTTL